MSFLALTMLSFGAYAQNSSIEEVIVSAEKRSESLQDVSQAVSALSDSDLVAKNALKAISI